MNNQQLIVRIANMENPPTKLQWEEIQNIAKDLTVRGVRSIMDKNPRLVRQGNDRLGEQVHNYL